MAASHCVTTQFYGLRFEACPWKEEEVVTETPSCSHYHSTTTAYCGECGTRRAMYRKRKMTKILPAGLEEKNFRTYDEPKNIWFYHVSHPVTTFPAIQKAMAETLAISGQLPAEIPHTTGFFTGRNWEE